MYLIIDNVTAIIRNMGEQIQYQSNGYPFIGDQAYLSENTHVVYVENVPDEVAAEEYCYTEQDGFYGNTNEWDLPDSVVQEIKNTAIAEVQEGEKNE